MNPKTKRILGALAVYIVAALVAIFVDAILIVAAQISFFGPTGPHIFALVISLIYDGA